MIASATAAARPTDRQFRRSANGARAPQFATWQYALIGMLVAALGMRVLEFFPILTPIKPIMLLVAGSFALFLVSSQGQSLRMPMRFPFTHWLLLFTVWMVACVPTSVWVGESIGVLRGFVPLLAGVWLVLAMPVSESASRKLQWIFVAGVACFAALNLITGVELAAGRYGGAIGLDVNDIALVLACCLPLCVGLALRSTGFARLSLWIVVAIVASVALRTGSRGGTLAIIAGSLVLLTGMPWRRTLQLLLIGAPLAGAAWFSAPDTLRSSMSALFAGEKDYNQTDDNGRIAIWKRGIRYGMQHPVLGVGPGGFITQDGIGKRELGLQGKWSTAHNTYVQAFAELGVPGFLLFLACIGSAAKTCLSVFRAKTSSPGMRRPEYFASLVALLVGATFLSFLYNKMTWVLLSGLVVMAAGARLPVGTTPIPKPSAASTVAQGRRFNGRRAVRAYATFNPR